MYYFAHQSIRSTVSIPLFLLVALLGPIFSLLIVSPIPVLEVVEVLIPSVVTEYGRFPIALTIPPVLYKTAVHVAISPAITTELPVTPIVTELRLVIPSIGVDAFIKEMEQTPEGAMAVPGNRFDVGWYASGTRPGEVGSAVIAGHNRWNDTVAVFDRLDQLKAGDHVSIVDVNGVSMSFVVRETRTYNPTDAADLIFLSESGVHLNLITCSGVWDASTNAYTERLVIFTDLE